MVATEQAPAQRVVGYLGILAITLQGEPEASAVDVRWTWILQPQLSQRSRR
mgnify:FL=1